MFAPVTGAGRAGTVEPLELAVDANARRARVVEVAASAAGKVDLTEAEVIVSGGRGLKGPENFKLLEELAEALGATVGASRAVVDAGWRPHADQVGPDRQDGLAQALRRGRHLGRDPAPRRHVVVAVHRRDQHSDPDAPIFKVADYGLVGDLFEVVPALTEAVRKLNVHV